MLKSIAFALAILIPFFLYIRFIFKLLAKYSIEKSPNIKKKIDSDILKQFVYKKPRFLEQYETEDSPSKFRNGRKLKPEFLSKMIKCKCGNYDFYVYASSDEDMVLAPIYLECSKCLSKNLIFDPSIHGWNGENGDKASLVGSNEPKKVNELPRNVIINYSYQGPENYAELIESGIRNPEDYFDGIVISTANENGKLEGVVAYECA